MNTLALRDHIHDILSAIVHDMQSQQTAKEKSDKSHGQALAGRLATVGQIHATLRIEYGFTLPQIVAEYRALRASVLRLWETDAGDPKGITRFNEAIDEALTEAVGRYTATTDHYRDQSLGILGHDLRNPLSAIITGCTLLTNSDELSDKSVRTATRMLNSANRMSRMINDLLDLTRTRLGDRIPVAPEAMDLRPLTEQLVAELAELHAGGALRFSGRGNLRGEWDNDRIAQVISNLIRNAIEHGKTDEPIDVIAEDHGDEVSLAVHNHGATIPQNALANIFEPMFHQGESDTRRTGLGLGLYIASQVVASHGGRIDVASSDADGTTFTVHLPRHSSRNGHWPAAIVTSLG